MGLIRILGIIVVVAAGLIGIACGVNGPKGENSAQPLEPDEYFSLFPFHISWTHDLGIKPEDEGKYRGVVAKLRENGIRALSEDELRLLVIITWYAQVMQETSTRHEIVESDSTGVVSIKEQEETYRLEPLPAPVAARVAYRQLPPAGYHSEGDAYADETLYFIEESNGGRQAIQTQWERRSEQWSCARGEATAVYIWGMMLRQIINSNYLEARAVGADTVSGRPAYKLEAPSDPTSSQWGGKPRFYWMDAETLLLVQEQTILDNGNTLLVTTLGLNPEVEITPPDVDVICTEKSFDSVLRAGIALAEQLPDGRRWPPTPMTAKARW